MYDKKECFKISFEKLNSITSQSCTCSVEHGGTHLWIQHLGAEVEGLWFKATLLIQNYIKIFSHKNFNWVKKKIDALAT